MPDEKTLGDYSLWLTPSGSAHNTLSSLIEHLSNLELDSPSFSPHVTLWYPIPIATPLDSITSDLRTLIDRVKAEHDADDWTLQLGPAQTGDKYYQSVLVPVVQPPAGLLALREACEQKWGPKGKEYFPHLSLFYGDASQARREEIAQKANEGFQAVKLVKEVRVGEVVVVNTRGAADEWKVVASVPI